MEHRVLLFLLLCVYSVNAQISSFSQYHHTPTLYNPALAGASEQIRIGTQFNYQTSIYPNGDNLTYFTNATVADMPAPLKNGDKIAWGLSSAYYSAESIGLKKMDLELTAAYHFHLSKKTKEKHYLGIGIGLAPTYSSYNFDLAVWSSAPPDNLRDRVSYFSISSGVNYVKQWQNGGQFQVGTSFYNLNRPNNSFFSNISFRSDIQWISYVDAILPFGSKLQIHPRVKYELPFTYSRLTVANDILFLFNEKGSNIFAGFGMTILDRPYFFDDINSVFYHLGFTLNRFRFFIAYESFALYQSENYPENNAIELGFHFHFN